MTLINSIILVVCLVTISVSNGYKILAIFPTPCKSHYILGETLLRGLVDKGHEVTMMSQFSLEKPMRRYTHVNIDGMERLHKVYWTKIMNVNTKMYEKWTLLMDVFPLIHQTVHNSTNVRKFVQKGEKFDLCIVSFMMMESVYAICNAIKTPAIGFSVIGLSSLITYHTSNPVPYSYVPNPFWSFTEDMTILERVLNTATWTTFDILQKFIKVRYHSRVVKQYYPHAPPLEEILNDVDLYLLNSHISTDSPKALLPNIIPIWGFHLQIIDEIPQESKDFLDRSQRGVIYFNLGTQLKSSDLSEEIINTFLKTFTKIDYDILWKYEMELPNKLKNVRTEKWLPQRAILIHPKVKMFITHGGLGGTVESIYGGVPMICMPIFGDQRKKCADSVKNGYSILLELASVTEETLIKSIREIETNTMYKEKVLLKLDLLRNQEINPMEKAIFWIEHVIRHQGAKHLKSNASNIPWYQYYLLDVFVFLSIILFALLFTVMLTIKLNWKLMCWFLRKCIKSKTE